MWRINSWRSLSLLLFLGLTGCGDSGAPPVTRDAQTEACVPDCTGKKCGSDGCGGICGVCRPFDSCTERFVCMFAPCARMNYTGSCCVGEVLLYCSRGDIIEQDCSGFLHCGWNSDQGTYLCNTTGGEDPSGMHKKACP